MKRKNLAANLPAGTALAVAGSADGSQHYFLFRSKACRLLQKPANFLPTSNNTLSGVKFFSL